MKKKLKYFIEFEELIDNPEEIESHELEKISRKIKSHLYKYLTYSGVQLHGELKLDFDLEEEET